MKRLTLSVISLLFVVACGMSTELPETVNKQIHINTPTASAAPTPPRAVLESTARACGSVWVRNGAGTEYKAIGLAFSGDLLYLTGEYKSASDDGKWMQVLDVDGLTGWVNARYLC